VKEKLQKLCVNNKKKREAEYREWNKHKKDNLWKNVSRTVNDNINEAT
jgi:hypothetical protein